MNKEKVVVFFGGKSVEREVSIITGLQVANNFNPFKFEVFCVYVDEKGEWLFGEKLKDISFYSKFNKKGIKRVCLLPSNNSLFEIKGKKVKKLLEIDYAVNCCHGTFGEDGTLAGAIKNSNINLCSPDVLSGSVSMDKHISKLVFKGLKFNVLPYEIINKLCFKNDWQKILNVAKKIGYPVIVKPCSLGSSVGVGIAKNESDLKEKLTIAFEFDFYCLLEKALTNFEELFCSCLGNFEFVKASEIEKNASSKLLDFNDKYIKRYEKEFPAKIDKKLKNEIKEQSVKLFKALKLCGVVRVDFLFDKTENKLYVNELNAIPGSLAFAFWKKEFSFDELLEKIVALGKTQHETLNYNKLDFHTNILENFEKGNKTKLK